MLLGPVLNSALQPAPGAIAPHAVTPWKHGGQPSGSALLAVECKPQGPAEPCAGIAALRALGYDDNADVATLLGYASRKLSRYDDAKMWYERALAADPNHAVTWSYYGMWQAEQGNVLKAKDDLEKVRLICGTDCKAFQMLKDAIDGTVTY